jgi:hypothetical protein
VKLAGGYSFDLFPVLAVRHPIYHQATRPTNPLPAIVVESYRILPFQYQLLIENIQHFQKGGVRTDIILYDPATGVWYQARNLVNGSFIYNSGNWAPGLTIIARTLIR